jgi:hypothetical protein
VVHVRLCHRPAELAIDLGALHVDKRIVGRNDFDVGNTDQDGEDQNPCEQKRKERLTYALILPQTN